MHKAEAEFLKKKKEANKGITPGFSCINICRVPRKLLKHEAARPSVQTSSEGPGKCYCTETNMCDSCILYDSMKTPVENAWKKREKVALSAL